MKSYLTRSEFASRCRDAQLAAQVADPDLLERRKAHGARVGKLPRRGCHSPERNAKASIAATQRYLGWCPPAYRESYRKLVRNSGIKAADARRMIEEQVARDHAQRLGSHT